VKRLTLLKNAALVAAYSAWATLLVSVITWSLRNIFSPHAGKLLILAVAITAAYHACCNMEREDRRAPLREAQRDLLAQANEEESAGRHYSADQLRLRASSLDCLILDA
jgi:hypothetical protein